MLTYKTHSDKLNQLISGELSLIENVKFFLQRISDNSHLNAFNQVFADEAILQAEIILIVLVILLLFGAKKIPELARGIGKGMSEFKKGLKDVEDEIKNPEKPNGEKK